MRDQKFKNSYYKIYSWNPNWPNCPRFGYPACKRIDPEKWKCITYKKDEQPIIRGKKFQCNK